ncbi:Pentatricopeptide repeat-containing protein [Drosera capensis]
MKECISKGLAVNVVNYTSVIHEFCQTDDMEGALSLLDDMYLNNKHPDACTYTVLSDALAKKGRIGEATELAMKMLKRGISPTPVTYGSVIHRYCQNGRLKYLLKLMEKTLSRQPFRNAYNQIIEKLCCFENISEAYELVGMVLRTASRNDAVVREAQQEAHLRSASNDMRTASERGGRQEVEEDAIRYGQHQLLCLQAVNLLEDKAEEQGGEAVNLSRFA